MDAAQPYFLSEMVTEVEFIRVEAFDTVVHRLTDLPMVEMSSVFDSAFSALFPVLESQGIRPIGPAFALYHRMPTDTVTFDVGIPVDKPLDTAITAGDGLLIEPSTLPGGMIARMSYMGPYDGLSEAWGTFMYGISTAGKEPDLPFWELYVSEPGPEIDPATLRTDLVSRIKD